MSGEICTCPDPAPSEGPGTPVVIMDTRTYRVVDGHGAKS